MLNELNGIYSRLLEEKFSHQLSCDMNLNLSIFHIIVAVLLNKQHTSAWQVIPSIDGWVRPALPALKAPGMQSFPSPVQNHMAFHDLCSHCLPCSCPEYPINVGEFLLEKKKRRSKNLFVTHANSVHIVYDACYLCFFMYCICTCWQYPKNFIHELSWWDEF